MNWLDIALALTFLISIVGGMSEGLTKAGIGFVASILGLVFGLEYYRSVAVSLHPYINHSGTAKLVGFLILYIGITMLGSVVAGILSRFVREIRLVWLDRLLGGAFGAVRGLWIMAVTVWALIAFLPVNPGFVVSRSRLAPIVLTAAQRVADASPDEVRASFRHSYHEMNKLLPERVQDRLQKLPASGTVTN